MYLFFDTETNGVALNWNAGIKNPINWPQPVTIAWIVADEEGNVIEQEYHVIKQELNRSWDAQAQSVHGVTREQMESEGKYPNDVYPQFIERLMTCIPVAHNINFDKHVVASNVLDTSGGIVDMAKVKERFNLGFCTMLRTTSIVKAPQRNGRRGYKWPSLKELHHYCFKKDFENAHNALGDVMATKNCFFELKKHNLI